MIASLVFHARTLSMRCEYFTRTFTFSFTLYTLHVLYTYTFYTFYSSLCNVYTILCRRNTSSPELKFIVQNSTLNKDSCILIDRHLGRCCHGNGVIG